MPSKKRSQKKLKVLTLFVFLEFVTVSLWELAMVVKHTPLTDLPGLVLSAGTLLSFAASLIFWNSLRKRYRKVRVRHVFADYEEAFRVTLREER